MKNIFLFGLFTLNALSAFAQVSLTQRKLILDGLRPSVESALNQRVKFVVEKLTRCKNTALVIAKPVNENGSEIDISKTKYKEDKVNGAFDNRVLSLMQLTNGKWTPLEFNYGGTDYPVADWVTTHHINACRTIYGLESN